MSGTIVLLGIVLTVAGVAGKWGCWVACLVAGGLLLAPSMLRTIGAALRGPGDGGVRR